MLCAIYCRLSKEDEDKHTESESIQNQKALLIKYATEREWDIYNIYCDEDYSGADVDRPDFCRLLRDAEEGRFGVILCKTQSRFTRDMEIVEKYIHGRFLLWGIRFVAVADNADTEVRGNKKARQINGLINEWYLEDLSENIRMVLDHKRRQGQYIGGFPVYGYKTDPGDKHHLIIDEEAADVVRQIFRWAREGQGKQHIANMLNERGILNPTGYKRLKGLPYRNGGSKPGYELWNKLTVSRMLCNEMYLGTMVQGRAKKLSYKSRHSVTVPEDQWFRVEGTHDAIIDRETFDCVQTLSQRRTRNDGAGEIHALAGLVRCAGCGSTMSKTSNQYKGQARSYLRCRLFVTSSSQRCSRHSIRLDELISVIEQRVRQYVNDYYELGDANRLIDDTEKDKKNSSAEKELGSISAQIEKRAAALKTLYLDKVDGLIDDEQFRSMNADFLSERKRLELRKAELERRLNEVQSEANGRETALVRARELLKLDTVPRELMTLLIDRVEVGEKDKEAGTQAVHILWRF